MVKYKNSTLLTEISLFEYLKNSKILYVGFTQNQTITISGLKNLFEVKSEFIFDPWVGLRTLLTCVQESFLSQLTGKQLAHVRSVLRPTHGSKMNSDLTSNK